MADFTFLFNRKGAIYPLDLDQTPLGLGDSAAKNASKNERSFKNDWPYTHIYDSSLVSMCARVIVNEPSLINKAADILPPELFVPLFKASLYPIRDQAIDILINKWPFKSLVVSKFLANMFTSLVFLYSDAEMGHRTRLGVKYSADIVHSFIDALRNRRTKLRYLDITGLPIAEIIIKYVATHCRLAQKEYQRNCLIDEYLQNVSDLESLCEKSASNAVIRNDLKKTTSLPDEKLIFKFDCILQERATFDELLGALEANAVNNKFTLLIGKLDLLCLGKTNIIKLLEKLDKSHIEGLRLQYNSITEESIKDIIPLLNQLSNLRSLDLSCNLIDYRQSARMMANAFGELKHLNRLDLSGSPLGGFLSIVLSEIHNPLQYLSLQSCSLTDTDLVYLANSKHVSVEHLDLSENRLNRYGDELVGLLRKCASNLRVLELDDNRFDCIDYLTLVCVSRKMPRLKMLATKGTFETNDHLLAGEFLQYSASLVAWRISYPIDVYDPSEASGNAQDKKKQDFVRHINQVVNNKIRLSVSELFL